MAPEDNYLAVLKASFDYDPQEDAEDELPIKEDELLFLIERVDESWWRVRVKTDSPDEQGPSGLVPAAYVEEAERIATVKVLYDYDAAQPSELNVQEDEVLYVFERDDGWLLVQSQKEGGLVGYVPENYTEEVSDDEGTQEAPAPSASRIVIPPSPPRAEYIDPADRVASHRVQADDIQTWAVSEVDKKGKKKKGTLGVGNGAIFFASESDKTPVQKWQTSDIQSARIEKNKHVHIDIGGPNPASLHFHAGSKDLAEAILKKLESSKALATPQPPSPQAGPSTSRPSPPPEIERPRSAIPKAVHFDAAPVIIPDEPEAEEEEEPEPTPRSAELDDYEPDHEPEPEPQAAVHAEHDGDGEPAVALYDFTADGDDEITIHEGEPLLVLDKDSEEWWKVRNEHGEEGVVPAQYVELASGESAPAAVTEEPDEDPDLTAAREAEEAAAREEAERVAEEREREERAERERAEKERKRKQEAETRAKAAAVSAEAERRRREQERERQKEKEKAATEAAEREEEERRKKANRGSTASDASGKGNRNSTAGSSTSRRSSDRRPPPTGKLRTWHDRTGQFKVEAVFLGYVNEKLRLHKANGVIIEVPAHKMSPEDMEYVEKALKGGRTSPAHSEDDEPLENRRKSLLQETPRSAPTKQTQPPKKGPTIDWFDFFLTAGCDLDDCTRYAASFERDKMDASILPDITEGIMRNLGLREGDIIRVKKAIETRSGSGFPSLLDEARKEQVRRDEELARKLQAEENNGKRAQAPNLFAGPNGVLKNNTVRRGRPQPSKSLPPAAVDIGSITSASDQIQRSVTPLVGSPATPGPSASTVTPPPRPSSATPAFSGFDDDAWTNRPASTKPLTPTPVLKAASPPVHRPPSAPAAPPPPAAPPAPSAVAQTQSLPNPATNSTTAGQNLAKTTEQDVFDQLARLSQLRVRSPPAVPPPPAPVASAPPPVPAIVTPPVGYQAGMGMGTSPIPIGQHLQAQQTGYLPSANGPRGPFAPVPGNQALLQPLIPTSTGFNSFVPTRPQSTPSSFQPQVPPLPVQPSFLSAQPTGYPGAPQSPFSQPVNGFNSVPMLSQPTGLGPNFGGSNFNNGLGGGLNSGFSYPPPVPPLPPAPMNSSLNGFGQLQPTPTGFNPGFNAMPFNHTISPPPPVPQQPAANTNPANVFAQMKSGTFANDNSSNPQNPGKYDALRPTPSPFAPQPTGFGGYGVGGMPGGYY